MIFEGIEPWDPDEPLIEVISGERVIDLHNWASFLGFEYRYPETLVLWFDYDETEGEMRTGSKSVVLGLRFGGVQRLRVHTEPLEQHYEGDTLSDFIYRNPGRERGSVEVSFMDGLKLEFEAGSVGLEQR